jgi:hypothetical protein
MIDGLLPNQGWWFMVCDGCSWKALEEGIGYRCTKKKWYQAFESQVSLFFFGLNHT